MTVAKPNRGRTRGGRSYYADARDRIAYARYLLSSNGVVAWGKYRNPRYLVHLARQSVRLARAADREGE